MGCCKDSARMYLKVLNALISLIGLGLVGAGVYVIVDESLSSTFSAINEFAVYAPVALGGIVFLVGMLGCCGATYQNKCALLLFWIILTAMMLAVMGMGIVFMLSTGTLDDVNVGSSAALVDDAQQKVNDAVAKVYDECCADQVVVFIPSLDCFDGIPAEALCVNDRTFYDSLSVADGVCVGLQEANIVNSDNCLVGGAVFKDAFTSYLSDNILPIGITLIVLSSLLLIADIFTCVLICTNRVDFDKDYRAKVQQQQNGVAVAGTTPRYA